MLQCESPAAGNTLSSDIGPKHVGNTSSLSLPTNSAKPWSLCDCALPSLPAPAHRGLERWGQGQWQHPAPGARSHSEHFPFLANEVLHTFNIAEAGTHQAWSSVVKGNVCLACTMALYVMVSHTVSPSFITKLRGGCHTPSYSLGNRADHVLPKPHDSRLPQSQGD